MPPEQKVSKTPPAPKAATAADAKTPPSTSAHTTAATAAKGVCVFGIYAEQRKDIDANTVPVILSYPKFSDEGYRIGTYLDSFKVKKADMPLPKTPSVWLKKTDVDLWTVVTKPKGDCRSNP